MKTNTAGEMLAMIADVVRERPTADVTVKISKDHIVITQAPPTVLLAVMESVPDDWRVSVADGGVHVTLK